MLEYNELPELNSERWLSLEDLPGEEWKDVPGYENILKVSNYSRIRHVPRFWSPKESIMKQIKYGRGYLAISISIQGIQYKLLVHRLVASAFVDNPENKPYIDHIDTNKYNNICSNLHWVTHKENMNNPLTKQQRPKVYSKRNRVLNRA